MATLISNGDLLFDHKHFLGAFSSAPDAIDGDLYINTSDNGYYIYGGGIWWLIATLTPSGTITYRVLLETGDNLLLENGDYMRTE